MESTFFEAMGDLPDDLLGSQPPRTAHNAPTAEPSADLIASWSHERGEGATSLIPNTISLLAAADNRAEKERKAGVVDDAVRGVRRLVAAGRTITEAEQTLAQRLTPEEMEGCAALAELRKEAGLMPTVYLRRDDFEKCSQVREFQRRAAARSSLFLVAGEQCKGCSTVLNGICQVSGLEVVPEMDYAPPQLQRLCKHLTTVGRIRLGAEIHSRDDLQREILAVQNPATQQPRVYPAMPRRDEPVDIAKALEQLAQESSDRATREQQKAQKLVEATRTNPLLRRIQEACLTCAGAVTLKEAAVKECRYRVLAREEVQGIAALVSDPLVRSKLMIDPHVYPSCREAQAFVKKAGVQPRYNKGMPRCRDCMHLVGGSCDLLNTKALFPGVEVDAGHRKLAVNQLAARASLSPAETKRCLALEDESYGSGLMEALRLHDKLRSPSSMAAAGGASADLTASAARCVDREYALKWAAQRLQSGDHYSSVVHRLREAGSGDADAVARDALRTLLTVGADTLDNCTQEAYLLRHDAVLQRAEKCASCPYGRDTMVCGQQSARFAYGPQPGVVPGDVPKEVAEFTNWFAGGPGNGAEMRVEIDRPTRKPTDLDVDELGPRVDFSSIGL